MRPVPKPSRKERLAEEKAARIAAKLQLAELRTAVVVRSRKWCEWCRSARVGELHHVVSGNGKRRAAERLDTLAAVCVACHHGWHEGDVLVMRSARLWAERHGFIQARTEIVRRLEKARAALWAGFGRAS